MCVREVKWDIVQYVPSCSWDVCFPNSILSSSFKTESELWSPLQVREKAGDVGGRGLQALAVTLQYFIKQSWHLEAKDENS